MKNTKLLIVADDFTGGLDTGVQFSKLGISVRIVLYPVQPEEWDDLDAEVLVVVAETRHLQAEDAYDTVYRIVLQGVQAGIPYVYKKTDSALRGNPGAELEAALHAAGADMLSFIPAYPAMNRITVSGIHYIDGIPVAESSFGKDPLNPVCVSNVRELLSLQTAVPVCSMNPDSVEPRRGILAIDARDNCDLKKAGEKLKKIGALRVSAGCAGFAAMLPELLSLHQTSSPAMPQLGDGLLVICGSINPATLRQLDYAEEHGFARFRLSAERTPCQNTHFMPPVFEKWLLVDSADFDCNDGVDKKRQYIMAGLADMFEKYVLSYDGPVLVTGGDTLVSCLKRTGVRKIVPLHELFPGVVLSKIQTPQSERLIISKSGGFGEKTLITDLRKLIECYNRCGPT